MLINSPYLANLIERFGPPDAQSCDKVLAGLDTAKASDLPTLKARFNLGWAELALNHPTPYAALGLKQSAFADRAVDIALQAAWTEEKLSGSPEGLFIFGLGKLGGHDLNFSSDIDLIAFYDPDRLPVAKARGQAYVAGRVIKRMSQILMPAHDPNFVYRVDWRLRPEASGTGLAMSTAAAEDFYFFRSLPWHRLALLKARVIAGDRKAGETFLHDLSPFIWRQNLDFRTIDELADLKSRINLEHPRLKQERQAADPIGDSPYGFNVKLGTGGIREIEFIANAQQLIWGGKHYELRTTNTLQAISALQTVGPLKATEAAHLSDAYMAFRRLENALQMMRNGHEHVLPDHAKGWTGIRDLLGEDTEHLFSRITAHREYVSDRFTAMFANEADQVDSNTPDLQNRVAFEAAYQKIVDDWESGFQRYNVRPSKRARLKPLGQALSKRIAQSPTPQNDISTLDAFLGNMSRSEQYLALLAAKPALLDALIDPLLHSPHMALLLQQSPHIIDTFLDPRPQDVSFVLAEADYETRLERLRRFVNEGLFQNYHRFLNETQDWRELARCLTKQADVTLETALSIMRDDLKAPDLRVCVLGLGKLGQSRMAPQSDLDLVFLFGDDVDRDLATKAVRRLTTILTTPLREGIAYELDMRLRPSGRSGPPAVTLSAFRKHHDSVARTWEHIALVPARIVAGDERLGQQVSEIINQILARPRSQSQLITDAHIMWSKLKDERIKHVPPDHFGTKLRDGGLMMADFWDAVGALANRQRLSAVQDAWTELLYWERLLGLTGQPIKAVPVRYADTLPSDLKDRHQAFETQVKDAVQAYGSPGAGPCKSVADMRPVRWK
jgi:glutamate-ammonia-ligase adenylyltransferase